MAKDPENEARSRALRNIRSAKARPVRDAAEWAAAITQGDRTALAQGISLIESRRESDRPAVEALLQAMPAPPHPTRRIGITGVPGVGKSTWIEAAGTALLERGHQVAVLAVDPSSSRTGGSMLGDKTRMESLSRHPGRSFGRLRQVTPSGAWRGPQWKPSNSVRRRDSTGSRSKRSGSAKAKRKSAG